jgi:hypothetical protein
MTLEQAVGDQLNDQAWSDAARISGRRVKKDDRHHSTKVLYVNSCGYANISQLIPPIPY